MERIVKLIKHKDTALSFFVLLLTLLFMIQSLDFEYPSNVFPWTMEALIAIFALIILLKPKKADKAKAEAENWVRITGIFIGTVFYLLVMPVIGFYLTSFLFIALASWILGMNFSLKMLGLSISASGAILLFIYLIFHIAIMVPVPRGMFF